MKCNIDKGLQYFLFVLCDTLCFFEELSVTAISQRNTKKTLRFTEKAIINIELLILISYSKLNESFIYHITRDSFIWLLVLPYCNNERRNLSQTVEIIKP